MWYDSGMSEKTLEKIQREANRLATQGFPFHAQLLRDSIGNGTIASTAERVAVMLERGKRYAEAKRVREMVART